MCKMLESHIQHEQASLASLAHFLNRHFVSFCLNDGTSRRIGVLLPSIGVAFDVRVSLIVEVLNLERMIE